MSQTEVELKLLINKKHRQKLKDQVPQLGVTVDEKVLHLRNTYFDTDALQLRQWHMGLRVRNGEGINEQTIKTAGQVSGGLHSRPEYNVPIAGELPDLAQFDSSIWPKNADIAQLQQQLTPLFNTDFTRHLWRLQVEQQQLEVCLDSGAITCNNTELPISEVELELIDDDPAVLFNCATMLAERVPLRLGQESKAKRGYQLAAQAFDAYLTDLDFIQLSDDLSPAQAFKKLVMAGLERWQQLELMLESYPSPSLWQDLRQTLRMLKLVLTQFQQLDEQARQLFAWFEGQLSFVDKASALTYALDINSKSLRKKLDPEQLNAAMSQALANLQLEQRLAGLLEALQYGQLQLQLLKLASIAQIETDSSDLRQHATRFQADSWQKVQQLMPIDTDLDKDDYLAFAAPLEKSLLVGVSYGELYGHAGRDEFRLPWNDMAKGINELACYQAIREQAQAIGVDIEAWLSRKEASLVFAMEQSRRSALVQTPYWQA
ncbi:inorganic triphosphatase [Paraferrimonas haliotis]|uniref:Adenylate cyclase n=1 Tax=Paraferrimonas haliotis TaxID=2013866 RepID=A0AA37WX98_9GAMM|nr:CYTH domain-containing protein [Paraferrimonas haliotis]GLS83209.1 adenylate cyclase [Paraferrimonas haliotis]